MKYLSEYSMKEKILRQENERDDELLGLACAILAGKCPRLKELLNELTILHIKAYHQGYSAGKKEVRNRYKHERKAA
jgi:hypothetical protein